MYGYAMPYASRRLRRFYRPKCNLLYEVLAFNAYHIAPCLLPTSNVRVIVDCGANIGITSLFLAAR